MAKKTEDVAPGEYIDLDTPEPVEITGQQKAFPDQNFEDSDVINGGYEINKKESGWNFENFSPSQFAINQINAEAAKIESAEREKLLREAEFERKLGDLLPRKDGGVTHVVTEVVTEPAKSESTERILARARYMRELRLLAKKAPKKSRMAQTYFGITRFGGKGWKRAQRAGIARRKRMAGGLIKAFLGSGLPELPYAQRQRPRLAPAFYPTPTFLPDAYSEDLIQKIAETRKSHEHVSKQNAILQQRRELEKQIKHETNILSTPSIFSSHNIDINRLPEDMQILKARNIFTQTGGASLMTRENNSQNILNAPRLNFGKIDPREQPQQNPELNGSASG